MIMVWLYIFGWSTYGPEAGATFAPEYKDTVNDTRKALASVGALNVFCRSCSRSSSSGRSATTVSSTT